MEKVVLKDENKRQSNFELLRIIAMLLIIAHHFTVHGGLDLSSDMLLQNKLWIRFIMIGGKVGVNIFVLISGYFLINSPKIKTNKIIKLILQITTYSFVIFLIFKLFGIQVFGIRDVIENLLPIIFPRWWFASTYFVLYLLSPYINKLLKSLDKSSYQKFLILLTICWCVIPTISLSSFESNGLLWFIYLYALAGYIRLYPIKIKISSKKYFIFSIILALLTCASTFLFQLLGTKIAFFSANIMHPYNMQSLPMLLISLFIFLGFSKINIGYKRFINIISSTTFGIYLLHDSQYVREFLWKTLFKNYAFASSNILIPYSIFAIVMVFMVCAIIELIRIYLLEKNYTNSVNKFSTWIDKKIDKLFSKRE